MRESKVNYHKKDTITVAFIISIKLLCLDVLMHYYSFHIFQIKENHKQAEGTIEKWQDYVDRTSNYEVLKVKFYLKYIFRVKHDIFFLLLLVEKTNIKVDLL